MRSHIDLAILRLAVHQPWLDRVLSRVSIGLARIRIHDLDWERYEDLFALGDPEQAVRLRADVFVQCAVPLRRYDICLLPVSIQTLGWTRQALAAIPRGPFVPLVAVTEDLRSGALLDLLELGLADFVGPGASPEEFRARLLFATARAPRAPVLRDVAVLHDSLRRRPPPPLEALRPAPTVTSACRGCFPAISRLGWPDIGFGPSKQRLIDLFEQQYLQRAMAKSRGNIAIAARNSQKDRRAFWELLRKHGLTTARVHPESRALQAHGQGGVKSEALVIAPDTP